MFPFPILYSVSMNFNFPYFNLCIQEGPTAVITATHTTEEILAQAMCQSIAVSKYIAGRPYAVGRQCPRPYPKEGPTCEEICASDQLHQQDSQTSSHTWVAAGAFHVYVNRPATNPDGTPTTAKLGLKSLWNFGFENFPKCGPNYCCCVALLPE